MLSEASRRRLIKLLKLTASPEDHEALSAIRRVNEALAKDGLSWDVILEVQVSSSALDNHMAATRATTDFWRAKSYARPQASSPPSEAFGSLEEFAEAWEAVHGKGPRHWIYDQRQISSLFDQLLNRGYVLSAREMQFIQTAVSNWQASHRLSDLQFATLAGLVERERRAGMRSF